jgi:hypothetical protein
LTDGSVYLWGISGEIQNGKENINKGILKKPTKISFKGSVSNDNSNNGNVSHRRRSNA